MATTRTRRRRVSVREIRLVGAWVRDVGPLGTNAEIGIGSRLRRDGHVYRVAATGGDSEAIDGRRYAHLRKLSPQVTAVAG